MRLNHGQHFAQIPAFRRPRGRSSSPLGRGRRRRFDRGGRRPPRRSVHCSASPPASRGRTASCSGPGWRWTRWPRTASAACRRATSRWPGRWRGRRACARWWPGASSTPGSRTRALRARGAAGPAAGTRVLLPVPQRPACQPGGPRRLPARRRTRRRRRWPWRSPAARSTSTATSPPTRGWPQDHPDLVLHLGDYLYEYTQDSNDDPRRQRRATTTVPETVTPGRLPAAARPVQVRRRPAGRARGRAVAGGAGTTTRWTTTGRTTIPENTDAGQLNDTAAALPCSAAPPRSRRTTRTCRCARRPCRPGPT